MNEVAGWWSPASEMIPTRHPDLYSYRGQIGGQKQLRSLGLSPMEPAFAVSAHSSPVVAGIPPSDVRKTTELPGSDSGKAY